MFFDRPYVAITTAAFLKKNAAIETAVVYDCLMVVQNIVSWKKKKKKKKIDVHMFFFQFLCSGIPDLALGILNMLIRWCFRDILQPAVY